MDRVARALIVIMMLMAVIAGINIHSIISTSHAAKYYKWQYKCEELAFRGNLAKRVEKRINKLGAEGWELTTSDRYSVYCFKRR